MKITEGKYFEFYERLEKLFDYNIKYLNHTILVDVFDDNMYAFLNTDYLKFSITKNGYQGLFLNICGFDEEDSILFSKKILESGSMRLLKRGDSFDVFSDKIEISNVPIGKVDLFNELDNKESIIKIYKDFFKTSIFSFDEEYSDIENSNSLYLNDLNLLLNMMLLAPKNRNAQDYINNKNKSVITLILDEEEIEKIFPKKENTYIPKNLGRNFDFIYDIMSAKQGISENPFDDKILINCLLRMFNVNFAYFSFIFGKMTTLVEIFNSDNNGGYELILVEKSKYPDFYDFIYKLKTKKDPNLKLFTYSCDIDFKVSDLDKIFTLKQ
jgi:hypothetical protein